MHIFQELVAVDFSGNSCLNEFMGVEHHHTHHKIQQPHHHPRSAYNIEAGRQRAFDEEIEEAQGRGSSWTVPELDSALKSAHPFLARLTVVPYSFKLAQVMSLGGEEPTVPFPNRLSLTFPTQGNERYLKLLTRNDLPVLEPGHDIMIESVFERKADNTSI